MAVISGYYTRDGNLIVLGADGFAIASDEDQERVLQTHLQNVTQTHATVVKMATFVVVVERNYGGAVLASRIFNILYTSTPHVRPMISMSQDKGPRPKIGVCTTNSVKERARIDLQRLLQQNKVRFAQTFVSILTTTRDDICQQLRDYKYEIKTPRDEFGSYKVILTGKGANKNDDLAIALNLLAFWPLAYLADRKHD